MFITGRIACAGAESIPVEEIARECYRSAGYVDGWFPSPEEVEVRANLCLGPLTESESAFREVSDDRSMVTGYAVDSPGTNWLPPEHWLVWRLSQCVQRLRAADPELALGPDGKCCWYTTPKRVRFRPSAPPCSRRSAEAKSIYIVPCAMPSQAN